MTGDYGLGWDLSDHRGCLVVEHGGAYDGMYSQVVLHEAMRDTSLVRLSALPASGGRTS